MCRGERNVGEVVFGSVERIQCKEDVEDEEELKEQQRKLMVDGVVLKKETCAAEGNVSTKLNLLKVHSGRAFPRLTRI